MIITFEEHTFEITKYEKDIIMPALVRIFKNSEKETVFSNFVLREILDDMGIKNVTPVRIRKLVHIIRCTDSVPFLIASGKGYKVTQSKKEINRYIQSLEERIERICITKNAIKRQLNNSSVIQKDIWTTT